MQCWLFSTWFLVFLVILLVKGLDSSVWTLVRLSIWWSMSYSLISTLIFRTDGILVFFLIGNKELYMDNSFVVKWKDANRGTTQGSVSGPFLFIFIIFYVFLNYLNMQLKGDDQRDVDIVLNMPMTWILQSFSERWSSSVTGSGGNFFLFLFLFFYVGLKKYVVT